MKYFFFLKIETVSNPYLIFIFVGALFLEVVVYVNYLLHLALNHHSFCHVFLYLDKFALKLFLMGT